MDLDDVSLDDIDLDLTDFEEVQLVRPLTTWRAWHQEPPQTSQRSTLQELQFTRALTVFGGNRSGKTEMGRIALVALLSGSDHPDARTFWIENGCDPDMFPRGPDSGWIIAVTSDDSLRYHRQQILSLIPKWGPRHSQSEAPGYNWHAWNLFGRGAARLEWMCPGYNTPAVLWFKSEDQDIRTFQGDAIRAALHDEEGLNGKRYDQTKFRLIDKDGYHLFTDTPIHGRSWVYNKFEKKDTKEPGVVTRRIYSTDNPYLPRHRLGILEKDDVRGKGLFVAKEGRCWPSFTEERNVLPAGLSFSKDDLIFRSIDFGTRHPFCCLWTRLLRKPLYLPDGRKIHEGSAIVFREHYLAGKTLAYHVARMHEYEKWRKITKGAESEARPDQDWAPTERSEYIEATWADSEDPQLILQLNNTHGIPTNKGNKSIKAGIDAVEAAFAGDEFGPRLYVVETCENLIREVEDYVWTTQMTVEGVEKEVPSGVSDHACDPLRYVWMGILAGYITGL